MPASKSTLTNPGTDRPAARINIKPMRLALLLCLPALLAASARAESAWSRIARVISPRDRVAQAVATTTQTSASQAGAQGVTVIKGVADEELLSTSTQATAPAASHASVPLKGIEQYLAKLGITLSSNTSQDDQKTDLGRESEEDEAMLATDLFKQDGLRRLLGDEPRFIYDPAERPDPMLVPWVRRAAIFKEFSEVAEALVKHGDLDKAIEVYKRILDLHDLRFTPLVQAKLQEIALKQAKVIELSASQQGLVEKIELPAWIHDNTTGVITAPGQDVCLIGDDMLHVGQTVPNYPFVKIATITPKQVVYEIKGKTFEVKLNDEQ